MQECAAFLHEKEYGAKYIEEIVKEWNRLEEWCKVKGYANFSESIGFEYCDEVIGTHLLLKEMPFNKRIKLRAVRMLTSYLETGEFEFRSKRVERLFCGETGEIMEEYLSYCIVAGLSYNTVERRRKYLHDFCCFLRNNDLKLSDISVDKIVQFYDSMGYTLPTRHNVSGHLRQFFKYLFEHKYTAIDKSIYIPHDNYRKHNKLPTTYTEEEIRRLIQAVNRTSPKGKRDYLVLLLASEYGWRSSDITHFRFDQIDWVRNVITFNQVKTDYPVEFPLLASVGNAIIDYMKNGRKGISTPEVIVSLGPAARGQPLTSPAIYSIVKEYMQIANLDDWQSKRHGPHALRHSLATNMLKNNESLPIISSVLGHQNTETTKIYIKVDFDNLKRCALPIPALNSPQYRKDR